MDKYTIYYNLDLQGFYTILEQDIFHNIEDVDREEIKEIKIESENIDEKIIEKIKNFKDFCKINKYNLFIFVFIDNSRKKINLKNIQKQFDKIKNLGLDIEVRVDRYYLASSKDYLLALKKIKDLTKKINAFRYNNEKLSPFEKWVIAFYFVANRVYNFAGGDEMRQWVGVLNGNNVICSGYSSLLSKISFELFPHNELNAFHQGSNVYNREDKLLGGHANNLVIINDDKYNIHGCYHSDSCWCSPKEITESILDSGVNYNYCLIPLKKLLSSNNYKFKFDCNNFIYKYLGAEFEDKKSIKNIDGSSIDNYILDCFGHKGIKTLTNEITEEKFNNIKEERLKIIQDRIKNKLIKNSNEKFLSREIPSLFVLETMASNNRKLASLLDNLISYINNKKIKSQIIISQLEDKDLDTILKDVDDIPSEISTGTISQLIDTLIEHYYIDKQNIINKTYIEFIQIKLEKEVKEFLKENKDLINPKQIEMNKYALPFEILANFFGVKNDKEIKSFVNKKLAETKKLRNKSFTGIFDPINDNKENTEEDFKF